MLFPNSEEHIHTDKKKVKRNDNVMFPTKKNIYENYIYILNKCN